jgi:hypothetical protein
MSSPHPNESSINPHGESTFEYVLRQLRLSPEEYAPFNEGQTLRALKSQLQIEGREARKMLGTAEKPA